MKIWHYFLGTLLVFGLLSWLSYHDGMAYDGLTTIGFPLTYYKEGVGQSLDTGQMEGFSHYSLLAVAANLICSFLTYFASRYVFNMWKDRTS